ncbi:MAG: PAS domain S-box protein, partial [Deltaproteobacteria bacterium]
DVAGTIIGSAVAIQDITAHREAEMKYSKILATALNGFWITNLQGRLLEVNDALCRMLGYTHEELLTLSIADVEADESPADVLSHIAALQQKRFDRFVSRHRRKDGSIIDVEVNSTWLDIGEGRLVSFMQDITERKRMEEAVRASEERFRALVMASSQGLYRMSPDWSEMRQLHSRTFLADTEYPSRTWLQEYIPPDDQPHVTAAIDEAIRTKSIFALEHRVRRVDGSWGWTFSRAIPLLDANGKIVEWFGAATDISARKQMEMQLKEAAEKYSALFDATSDGVWIHNLNGEILEVNDAYCRMSGYSRDELIHMPISKLEGVETPEEIAHHIKKVIDRGGHDRFESRHRRKDGSIFDVDITALYLEREGGRIAIFARDITRRKQAELLSQALNDINLVINSTLDFNEIMNRAVVQACKAVGAESAAISLRKGNGWVVSYGYNFPEEIIGLEMADEQDPHAVMSIETQQVVFINDAFTDERVNREHMQEYNVRSVMVIPLVTKEKAIGVLFLNYHTAPITFAKPQIDFAGKLGAALSLVMENAKLFEALRRSRDELEIRVQERTAELANANEGLRVEITERKRTEEALRKLTYDLNERVKEINCLYSVSYYVDKQHLLLNEKLKHIVNIIPSGWQFAELTCARIVLEGREYKTENFRETPWKQSSDIIVHGEKIGTTDVFYLEKKPEDYEGPFFKAERDLINAIAVELGEMIARNRAEEAIKKERQRFYDVLEMLPAYLVLLTPDYHLAFVNRFFRERFGESHNQRCFEYLFGRCEPCEICETYTVLKTKAPHHWEWTGPDGRIYDVSDFPFTDTDGSVSILEMGIDITERKRAEESLRAAHQYNRSLIEASLDPLVTINPEGKVTDVNTATELATGVSREQLIGSDFSDYFTEPDKAREGYRTAFLKGTVRDFPLAIRHKSGMTTDVLYNATIYRNETGEIQGVFAAARDITERKRTEEALRESEVRLRALSSRLLTAQESERKRIALELHDGIGQMLTAIKFKAENTLQEKGRGKGRAEGKSLEAIIPLIKETIEEVRRMQMDLRPSTLDDLGVLATLGWFCREYQKIYSRIRIQKEIALQEDEVSAPLKVVLYRLTQEAMNNIAKHTQAGLVRLTLRNQETEIEWVIEDNGMGFDLEKILSSEGSKRGLGLSSMRERTEFSGGKFMIESTRGMGTTVRASWPL